MAIKRMFSKEIVESDAFLDMSASKSKKERHKYNIKGCEKASLAYRCAHNTYLLQHGTGAKQQTAGNAAFEQLFS